MASYSLNWKNSTRKDFKGITKNEIPKIIKAVESLCDNPYPHGCIKLSGSEFTYRIRVGDYRVIYEVYDDIVLIIVIRVRHRKDVYRQ